MSILKQLMAFFDFKRPTAEPATGHVAAASPEGAARVAWDEDYWIRRYKDIASESKEFTDHYGDFNLFLYKPGFDNFLRKEVLFFREPDSKFTTFLDNNHWQERHPFNFPGPFYTGPSDTCGTGVGEAPQNVMNDAHCCEFVFRQPRDFTELLQVLDAAAVEVFDSYSSNGNDYWTYELCKEWWHSREVIIVALRDEELERMNNGQAQLYLDYLAGEAERDLRRYCYFLLNGSYPAQANVDLPIL